jgi:glycosylphosphatidylinositol transamidase (GPIT) subunit GPI8
LTGEGYIRFGFQKVHGIDIVDRLREARKIYSKIFLIVDCCYAGELILGTKIWEFK